MKITKEQWNEYRDVQINSIYNMLDPNARAMTDLTRQEWIHIIKNYTQLKNKYEGEEE
tara:strand:- start:464 stop:637 length:174 start_codon:yes stop_codon:yes gene_type:complete